MALALPLLHLLWDSQEQDEGKGNDAIFYHVYQALGGAESDNPEFLLVAGHMITLF